MSFINFPSPTPVFPDIASQGWPVNKKPSFVTDVTTAISGQETQIVRAAFPLWEFELTFGTDGWLRDSTQNLQPFGPIEAGAIELQQISGLFLACRGSYGEFYFNDPQDHSRYNAFIGYGDGVTTIFPLYFPWGDPAALPAGTPEFYSPIGGINSIQQVRINNNPISDAYYGPDSTNSQLQFSSPPPVGLAINVDFYFYFRCRFLEDQQSFSQWAINLWEYKSCKFRSVKP